MDLDVYDTGRHTRAPQSPIDWWDQAYESEDETDDINYEDDEEHVLATRGAFAVLSNELLIKMSQFLDLESLCRGMCV